MAGLAKAAITCHLVPIVADLWGERHSLADENDRHALLAPRALVRVYESYDSYQYRLATARLRGLQDNVDAFPRVTDGCQ